MCDALTSLTVHFQQSNVTIRKFDEEKRMNLMNFVVHAFSGLSVNFEQMFL